MATAQVEVFQMQIEKGMFDAHDIEQRTRSLWKQDKDLRTEFLSLDTAIGYFKALGRGNVRVLQQ